MAGVSATDNADGDLTGSVQVITDLDITTPGVYVLTYMVEDSTGNQATDTQALQLRSALLYISYMEHSRPCNCSRVLQLGAGAF